jgi:hypothetical protein
MPAIMADNDSTGQFAVILALLESDAWNEFWETTNCSVTTFKKLGLEQTAPDAAVWHTCQEREVILVTSNRNAEGAESLEATIRASNTPNSLPVITIADPQRLMESKAYAERAVARLLDYLMDLENYRGTGRLFVP